ncbi:uncharacterized protein LOC114516858 [Dendronephthya gigantea]|uniref:uncharacterized protein LOC114516858 n=1 Tax=Dendronephthya gigantea TaxID=151771 RepID=UPI00106A3D5A|nr:uncharacterized protein LOC114516858 [Dendronephthya gigantea]
MVERLYTRRRSDPTECGFLPTIIENLEGFQATESDEAILRTRFGRHKDRARRNSYPNSIHEGLTGPRPASGVTRCKQSPRQTKCRKCNSRDPMLRVKAIPKQDNIVFDKHKLDKIEEGESQLELAEENDGDREKDATGHDMVDISNYSKIMTGRRGSYPVDSTDFFQSNTLARDIRDYSECKESIVTRWMKFF